MKKHFLYCRVATGHQSTGLEAQIRTLREYCERKGISNYVIYQDENQSGTKRSRPGLNAMMEAVKNGEAESVTVYSFSRFARSVTHLLQALEKFKELGVKFTSVSESLDTETALGQALFTILGAIAQLERDILAERVRVGLHNARMKGVKIGRKKTRPSELIRTLRKSGMTFREISRIAGCSQGAVSSEVKLMKEESEQSSRKAEPEPKQEELYEGSSITLDDVVNAENIEIVRY